MTRINVGIDPVKLTDEHLRAEHREIKRVCSNYYKRSLKGPLKGLPEHFTLGPGHVLFFLDKPVYTLSRYQSIRDELLKRGFSPTNFADSWSVYSGFKGVKYMPTESDKSILVERISSNIESGKAKYYHYYGNLVTKSDAIKLLKV